MSQVITLDDLTNYMPTTTLNDGLAQVVVDGMNQWVDTRTGRCFGETKQVVGERYSWASTVWLRHMDIVSIDAVTLGWPGQTTTTVDSSAYYLNPLGRITFFSYGRNNMSRLYNDYMAISYTYGVLAVPDDLKAAVLGVAAGFYDWASNGQREVASVSVGSYQVAYTNKRTSAGSTPDPATSSSDANWAVIESYRLQRQ